ncbi:MAG: ribonucleoside triphosphate reductase [Patescibacteria group bacterium]
MTRPKFTRIRKRDGQIVDFNLRKIEKAIFKAITATDQGDGKLSKKLSQKVEQLLEKRLKKDQVPSIEQIQDIVEEVLILEGYTKTAKAYILYREQHRRIREAKKAIEDAVGMVEQYLEEIDWEVHENSNMAYSLQGLNNYVSSAIIKKYWLNKIYPPEIREATKSGDFHVHNLQTLGAYCCGWDLYDLLLKGFRGVFGKVESKPAKHFRTALGQLVNFFYTLQGEAAGAQAVSSLDTLLAPFIRYDNLNYQQVKQGMQEFLFNCAIPTRVGFQTPFTNVTLDIKPPSTLANQPILIGGKTQKETYGEFQEEMNMFNRAFYEGMIEGDAKGRPFTFPIPTVNITPDFDWQSSTLNPLWEATAKYGVNYFSNFINSEMKPDDVRSMCCRLRLDKRELYHRGGGLFGSNPLTGSIGVVTINMPRIGYLSKNKKDFFERLTRLMDLAKQSLEIKRKTVEGLTEKGLYPYSRYYLEGVKKMRGHYWANHFSTIGLIGLNEALLNFKQIKSDIGTKKGKEFAEEVLTFMREKMIDYQGENGNMYNLEATPAEGTSYRLAQKDREKYPNIITAGTKEVPYYTNSSQLPVDYTDDVFEALDLQDDLQTKYTGGTVLHLFLGERINDIETVKKLMKKIFEKHQLPYVTLTPTFSICPVHGYISGEHFTCPKCVIPQTCEVYSRIVGYLRPVQQWNKGKQEEFKERKTFEPTLQN